LSNDLSFTARLAIDWGGFLKQLSLYATELS
jgi:hypothetical protein